MHHYPCVRRIAADFRGGKPSICGRVMTRTETPIENLRGYLPQLSPQTRTKLLAEVERLRQNGDDLPGADIILAELRADAAPLPDPRADGKAAVERRTPTARYFFKPIEPYLTDRTPERANAGLISRFSLFPIWEWIGRDLMASLARAYAADMKSLIAAKKEREADLVVQAFQNKAVKYLEGTLASKNGADHARSRLAARGGSRATFDDLNKILEVL